MIMMMKIAGAREGSSNLPKDENLFFKDYNPHERYPLCLGRLALSAAMADWPAQESARPSNNSPSRYSGGGDDGLCDSLCCTITYTRRLSLACDEAKLKGR